MWLMRICNPLPAGVPGELLIGGEGLARGCHRRELTAQKFIADPFGSDGKSRLYRTGDLVRYRADGTLDFLGRLDQQVKIRGFRIELEEIEQVMRDHPDISDAAVAIREEEKDQRLVAYFVAAAGSHSGPAELRDYLKTKLPGYMVPATFIALEKLPLTPNGKLDRKALPTPTKVSVQLGARSDRPKDMLEQQLAQLWRRILRGRVMSDWTTTFLNWAGTHWRRPGCFMRSKDSLAKTCPWRHSSMLPRSEN